MKGEKGTLKGRGRSGCVGQGRHTKKGIGKLSDLDAEKTKKKEKNKMCDSSGVQEENQARWDTRAERVCEAKQSEYAKYV